MLQVVAATGILAELFSTTRLGYDQRSTFYGRLAHPPYAFFVTSCAMFGLFLALALLRCLIYPRSLAHAAQQQQQYLFAGLIPVALAIIIDFQLSFTPWNGGRASLLTQSLYWSDLGLTLLSCGALPILVLVMKEVKGRCPTAAWILPLMPAIMLSGTGALLAARCASPRLAGILLVVSYVLWGMGVGVALLITSGHLQQHVQQYISDSDQLVTSLLPLGAVGMGISSLVELSNACSAKTDGPSFLREYVAIRTGTNLVGLIMWGFGLWLLVYGAVFVGIRVAQNRGSSMALWVAVFPIGAFIRATNALSFSLSSGLFKVLAIVMLVPLVLLWVLCAMLTMHRALTGSTLQPPCLSELSEEAPCSYERAPDLSDSNDHMDDLELGQIERPPAPRAVALLSQ